ncbi:MAG: FRG domain-containing protein [Henriciella sp.]
MAYETVQVSDIGEFVAALLEDQNEQPQWFRGQRNTEWKLVPSLARGAHLELSEGASIKRFKQNALQFLPNRPADDWEWLFLMQHHRAPTRLLDWSESALVAMHFALQECPEGEDDQPAAVWRLHPVGLNNVAGYRQQFDRDILAFGIDNSLDNYLPDKIGRESDLLPAAGIAGRNSVRMIAQLGTFTITHFNHTPIEDVDDGAHVKKFEIPVEAKPNLRQQLRSLGINEFMMFPDLDQVSKHVQELFE